MSNTNPKPSFIDIITISIKNAMLSLDIIILLKLFLKIIIIMCNFWVNIQGFLLLKMELRMSFLKTSESRNWSQLVVEYRDHHVSKPDSSWYTC